MTRRSARARRALVICVALVPITAASAFTPATLRALLDGLDEPWVRGTEGPETFSPFDVVGHLIDGEGVNQGPDLTRAGKEHDAKWLHAWISDPAEVDELADMPAFNDRLKPEELTAIANYLAARK